MLSHYAAVIHAKLFLFEFASFMRVVISSANLTRQDWEGLAQLFLFEFASFRVVISSANFTRQDWETVWVQDFARINPPPQQMAEFGIDLSDFLLRLGLFETPTDASQYLQPFDFSPAIVKLIASVPGVFTGPEAFKYPKFLWPQ